MQKRIFLSPPWFGIPEKMAVAAAFDSGYVAPCGPMVDAFDQRLGALSGCSATAVASGTAAMDLIMAEIGVGPEDVVIASTLTFVATVGPAFHRGAQLEFVDTDSQTGTISLPLLEQALLARRTHNARERLIVIAADVYGQCSDYASLEELCNRYEAILVLDAAEAVGATSRGRPAGHGGLVSLYSFNGNKIITTSGGGAVLSRDSAIVERARWRAQQARENVLWYEHQEVGYNYRMSNLLGALGCAQLDRLPEIIRRKRRTFAFYQACLDGAATPFPCDNEKESTHWLSVFELPSAEGRDALLARLNEGNIESRPVWKPLHLQPVFKHCKIHGGEVAEDLFMRGICLPSGAGLTVRDLQRIKKSLVK